MQTRMMLPIIVVSFSLPAHAQMRPPSGPIELSRSDATIIEARAQQASTSISGEGVRQRSRTSGLQAQAVTGVVKTTEQNDAEVRGKKIRGLLGMGFDIWSNKATLNPCVVYSANLVTLTPAVNGVPSPHNWSRITGVDNLTEHSSASSSGISATLTYNAFSLGASHADAQANHYSSFSSYIDVDKGVVGDSGTLDATPGAGTINPSLIAKTALMAKDPTKAFTDSCGQGFITAVYLGAHLVGSLDFVVTLDSNAKSNSTAVSASIGKIIGGSYSDAKSWSDLSQSARLAYNVQGGPAEDQDHTKWLTSILEYGKDGAFDKANERILVEVTPYSVLSYNPMFARFVDPSIATQGSVTAFRLDYMDSVQQLTDLLAARKTPDIFNIPASPPAPGTPPTSPPPPVSMDERITALSTYLDNAGQVYLLCRKAITATDVQLCSKKAHDLGLSPRFYPPLALK